MNEKIRDDILKQIDTLIDEFNKMYIKIPVRSDRGNYQKYQNIDKKDYQDNEQTTQIATRIAQMVFRLAPSDSFYVKQITDVMDRHKLYSFQYGLSDMIGVLKALRADYEAGFLQTVTEIVQANLFADFLEMAEYLQKEGYKDAAAVITGSILEEHLRKLCQKNGLPVEDTKPNGDIVPRKANQLNQDLAGINIFTKLDQKSVTTWLEIRNNAAHGKYDEYSKEQVRLMIQGIQDFLTRHLA